MLGVALIQASGSSGRGSGELIVEGLLLLRRGGGGRRHPPTLEEAAGERHFFANVRAIWRHRGSSLLAGLLAGGLLGLEMQFLKRQGFQDEISQRRVQPIQAERGGVVRGRRKQARWQTVDGVIRALWLGDSSRWRVAAVSSRIPPDQTAIGRAKLSNETEDNASKNDSPRERGEQTCADGWPARSDGEGRCALRTRKRW